MTIELAACNMITDTYCSMFKLAASVSKLMILLGFTMFLAISENESSVTETLAICSVPLVIIIIDVLLLKSQLKPLNARMQCALTQADDVFYKARTDGRMHARTHARIHSIQLVENSNFRSVITAYRQGYQKTAEYCQENEEYRQAYIQAFDLRQDFGWTAQMIDMVIAMSLLVGLGMLASEDKISIGTFVATMNAVTSLGATVSRMFDEVPLHVSYMSCYK